MKYYKRNTLTLISILLSCFALLGTLVWVPGVLDIPVWRYHAILITFLLLAPIMNSLMQNLVIFYVRDPDKFFFRASFKEKPVYELIICISAIVLLPLVPGITLVTGIPFWSTLLYMLLWLVIAGATTVVSYKTVNVDFYSDVVCVSGLNFFKNAGMSQKSMTATGIYEYEEFQDFTVEHNVFTMNLMNNQGHVVFSMAADKINGIAAFLTSKGIERV